MWYCAGGRKLLTSSFGGQTPQQFVNSFVNDHIPNTGFTNNGNLTGNTEQAAAAAAAAAAAKGATGAAAAAAAAAAGGPNSRAASAAAAAAAAGINLSDYLDLRYKHVVGKVLGNESITMPMAAAATRQPLLQPLRYTLFQEFMYIWFFSSGL